MAKIALLVGVSEYQVGLTPLHGAVKDIEAMQRVLQDAEMGGFDQVIALLNPEPLSMQEAIETLFSGRNKNDLVLLFFSGHGVKDDGGRLYFATRLTRKNEEGALVKATAVPASFVQDIMSNSRCKRQVVILDCCFSGAFAMGMTAKDDSTVDIQAQLGGEGRAILTSSTATQYSFELQESSLSIYTRYVVEGIETGAADTDGDGVISINELHDYARKKVQEATPAMNPKIYAVEEGFKIRLAKARVTDPKLKYRREAQSYAKQGEISLTGRRILDNWRERLGIPPEEATSIEDEILQPYRERLKNLQKYEDALVAAIKYAHPLNYQTRNELKIYQEMLGLRDEDVLPIEEKATMYCLDGVPSDSQQSQTFFSTMTQPAASDAPISTESKLEEAVIQQKYRNEVMGFTHQGKISFVGRRALDVLKTRLGLDAAVAKAIEVEVLESYHVLCLSENELKSEQEIYYGKLQELLKLGKWQEANEKTWTLILQVSKREQEGWLRLEDVKKLSCSDLRIINQLWTMYSDDHFGFSVQERIWQNIKGNEQEIEIWNQFAERTGWRENGEWCKPNTYRIFKSTFEAPEGYLPTWPAAKFGLGKYGSDGVAGTLKGISSFALKILECCSYQK